mgnify:FL=1
MPTQCNDDRMTSAPVWGEFVRFSLPSVVGMLAISSATIVDGLVVGNYVGAEALAAVTIVMPLISVLIGILIMLSVGSAVMAGKMVGEGNPNEASGVLGKTSLSILLVTTLISLIALLWPETLVQFMGAKDDVIATSAHYLWWMGWFLPFLGMAILLMQFLRIDGKPGLSLNVMLGATVINIVLDIVLVVFMDMGVEGAALATGVSYLVGALVALPAFIGKGSRLHFAFTSSSWSVVYKAALNGASEFLNEASSGFVMLVFNWVLMSQVGTIGVASFAIVNYLMMIGLMIFYGVTEALGALFAVNFGARKEQRVSQLLRYGLGTCVSIGIAFALVLFFYSDALVSVFADNNDTDTQTLAISIAMAVWPVFLFVGANVVITGYFTGMQKPALSATLAALRSLVLPIVFILLLWQLFGFMGVFYALPLAEFLTLFVSLLMLAKNLPKVLIEVSAR